MSRFSPEIKRDNLAFMSFGSGPRNCIGKSCFYNKIVLMLYLKG